MLIVSALQNPPLFIEGQREMSVACDDENFSSPKSSQEGVAFPFGRRTRFQTKCGVLIIQTFLLRATLVTPPPLRGTPSINRGGFCKALTISIVGESESNICTRQEC